MFFLLEVASSTNRLSFRILKNAPYRFRTSSQMHEERVTRRLFVIVVETTVSTDAFFLFSSVKHRPFRPIVLAWPRIRQESRSRESWASRLENETLLANRAAVHR